MPNNTAENETGEKKTTLDKVQFRIKRVWTKREVPVKWNRPRCWCQLRIPSGVTSSYHFGGQKTSSPVLFAPQICTKNDFKSWGVSKRGWLFRRFWTKLYQNEGVCFLCFELLWVWKHWSLIPTQMVATFQTIDHLQFSDKRKTSILTELKQHQK